ncbi:MAG: CotH kinase family protein [Bacteroidales bacterium]|nr:CotH kinase family protein [Bacteroidales bacterium]
MIRNHHKITIAFLALLLSVTAWAQADTVVFSAHGGFYENSFQLQLSNSNPDYHIRYTINGNRPTAQSALYANPLVLDEQMYSKSDIYTIQISTDELVYNPGSVQHCIVVRAAVFDENDSCVSSVKTNSYFIGGLGCDTHGLPVVSICADSLDLFDYDRGIFVPGAHFDSLNPNWTGNYYQKGIEWERLINVEFYELDNKGINQQAGIRTHGGNGRRLPQKSVKIYAREEYGKKRFKHKFFNTIPHNKFKHLVFKPMESSWNQAGMQDHVANLIVKDGVNVEPLASRPVVMYINGEYWGLYFIHEKPDERYLEDHLSVNLETLNMMGNWVSLVDYGNGIPFINMMGWLENADLSNQFEYNIVDNFFDLDSFIDYQIFEIYTANKDWPANNMACWQADNGKWRWIFKDGDACFLSMSFDAFANAIYYDKTATPARKKSTLLFRKLLENDGFRMRFKNRFLELINTSFNYQHVWQYVESTKNAMSDEIPYQSDRFGYPQSMESWLDDVEYTDWFLANRGEVMTQKLSEFLDVEEIVSNNITVYPNPAKDVVYVKGEITGYELYDLIGNKLEQVVGNMEEIRVSDLSSGVYIIRLHTKNGKASTKKIIINN